MPSDCLSCASEAEDADGLVMTMTEAPLFAKGLPERAQALCDALRAAGLDAVQGVDGALGREMGVRGARIIHGGMSR